MVQVRVHNLLSDELVWDLDRQIFYYQFVSEDAWLLELKHI